MSRNANGQNTIKRTFKPVSEGIWENVSRRYVYRGGQDKEHLLDKVTEAIDISILYRKHSDDVLNRLAIKAKAGACLVCLIDISRWEGLPNKLTYLVADAMRELASIVSDSECEVL